MANTMIPIQSVTLSSSQASVTFSSIPQTYTDLVLRLSARTSNSAIINTINVQFNNDTSTNYSFTRILGQSADGTSSRETSVAPTYILYVNGDTSTANTFSNGEMYIPNYTIATNKPQNSFTTLEHNATTGATIGGYAHLWRNAAAITGVTLSITQGGNFLSGSSFFLYGIS